MIISVSMNPSIDKIIYLSKLNKKITNRVESSSETAGGKGINVANVLSVFTKDLVLTGFCGNSNSEIIDACSETLKSKGVIVDYVKVDGRNRTNMKIIESDGSLTEINESGFPVTIANVCELREKLYKYAKPGNIFILMGSLPKGVDKHIYADITKDLKAHGATVFVDTSGEALKYAIEERPDMIKPNQEELLELFDERNVSEKTLIKMATELCEKGIGTVIVSRGSLGSLFVRKDKVLRCDSIPVKVRSSVGAGDAMTACFAYATSIDLEFEECAELCVAAASHTVTLDESSLSDRDEVEKLVDSVKMTVL